MKTAIVLSGHTMALGVVRALGEKGVPVIMVHYDERDMGQVSKFIVQKVSAPHPEKNEKEFIDLLINKADQFGGGVLFPVSDETLVAVSQNIEKLKEHYLVACPEWEVVQKYVEKKYTYSIADANGVPAPKTIIPKSVEDVENYAKGIDFPCLVKPSQSHLFYDRFKCKMFPAQNPEELISIYNQTVEADLEVMLQEIIPGDDCEVVNYNAYFAEGKPIAEFTAQHIRNAPPLWGSPRVVLSKEIPELIEPGRKILEAMGFNGFACTEFKRDTRNGVYKLIEVNGRHNLSTLLAVRCGMNFPWLQYNHLVNGDLSIKNEFTSKIYWIDIPRDLGYSLKFLNFERYSLRQYFLPYLKPHVFANLDFRDIRPFIKRMSFLIKQGIKAVLS